MPVPDPGPETVVHVRQIRLPEAGGGICFKVSDGRLTITEQPKIPGVSVGDEVVTVNGVPPEQIAENICREGDHLNACSFAVPPHKLGDVTKFHSTPCPSCDFDRRNKAQGLSVALMMWAAAVKGNTEIVLGIMPHGAAPKFADAWEEAAALPPPGEYLKLLRPLSENEASDVMMETSEGQSKKPAVVNETLRSDAQDQAGRNSAWDVASHSVAKVSSKADGRCELLPSKTADDKGVSSVEVSKPRYPKRAPFKLIPASSCVAPSADQAKQSASSDGRPSQPKVSFSGDEPNHYVKVFSIPDSQCEDSTRSTQARDDPRSMPRSSNMRPLKLTPASLSTVPSATQPHIDEPPSRPVSLVPRDGPRGAIRLACHLQIEREIDVRADGRPIHTNSSSFDKEPDQSIRFSSFDKEPDQSIRLRSRVQVEEALHATVGAHRNQLLESADAMSFKSAQQSMDDETDQPFSRRVLEPDSLRRAQQEAGVAKRARRRKKGSEAVVHVGPENHVRHSEAALQRGDGDGVAKPVRRRKRKRLRSGRDETEPFDCIQSLPRPPEGDEATKDVHRGQRRRRRRRRSDADETEKRARRIKDLLIHSDTRRRLELGRSDAAKSGASSSSMGSVIARIKGLASYVVSHAKPSARTVSAGVSLPSKQSAVWDPGSEPKSYSVMKIEDSFGSNVKYDDTVGPTVDQRFPEPDSFGSNVKYDDAVGPTVDQRFPVPKALAAQAADVPELRSAAPAEEVPDWKKAASSSKRSMAPKAKATFVRGVIRRAALAGRSTGPVGGPVSASSLHSGGPVRPLLGANLVAASTLVSEAARGSAYAASRNKGWAAPHVASSGRASSAPPLSSCAHTPRSGAGAAIGTPASTVGSSSSSIVHGARPSRFQQQMPRPTSAPTVPPGSAARASAGPAG